MQGPKDNLDGLQGYYHRKDKAKPISKEEASVLLAIELYADYLEAYSEFWGVEAEHFAEEWIKKNVPGKDRMMRSEVWRYFMMQLSNRRERRDQ